MILKLNSQVVLSLRALFNKNTLGWGDQNGV